MANYLPVLLVSVTAGMPDDAALQPLPRGQVDYLSHQWAEEDVWRSWRNMTKQKNDIANGVRLENASWRTWMKQRNNLKTVSPETLNWLKDSDVTWLYGPLHTAVDWESKAVKKHFDARLSRHEDHPPSINSISSPSSSITLDRMCDQHPNPPLRTSSHEHPQSGSNTTKSILKHRSIAEMLTGALPPTPAWAEQTHGGSREESSDDDGSEGASTENGHDPREGLHGRVGRPPLYHTRSDTATIPKFGKGGTRKEMKILPPRIADATSNRESEAPSNPYLLHDYQRTGASNNLLEMAFHASSHPSSYSQTTNGQTSPSPSRREGIVDSPSNDDASGSSGVRFEDSDSVMKDDFQTTTQPPTKKHISFNAIVEQCISIENSSVPATPSQTGPWRSYEEESDMDYDPMEVDFSSESTIGDRLRKIEGSEASANQREIDDDMDDDDSLLEFKTSSRRNSTASLPDYGSAQSNLYSPYDPSRRPHFRRSSTGSSLGDRGTAFPFSRSSKRSNTSASRSRSSGAQERDRATIAPIAPTILKAGGSDGFEDGTLYMGGTPVFELSTDGLRIRDVDGNNERSTGDPSNISQYGYGGYGFGDRVSAGRDDAFRNFERGTEAGELVFQSPNGNIYPWNEKDAIRFCMASEFGLPSPSSSPGSQHVSTSSCCSSDQAQFVPLQASSSPREKDEAEQAEVEHYDEASRDVQQGSNPDISKDDHAVHQTGSSETSLNAPGHPDQPTNYGVGTRMRRGDSTSSSGDSDDRSSSPEIVVKQNPRVASLKTDGHSRQPGQSNHVDYSLSNSVGVSPIPIVRPHFASGAEPDSQHRLLESPTSRTGFLSPPDLSPRGRWLSTPPESSGSGTPSYFESGSRSTSESRSDSRGRSQTRNSSLTSSDTNEPERGRSRSRSIASGTNSPLRESASGSCSPIAGGISIGLGIGGSCSHVGREIRDGKGTKLYRKTSEDNLGDHYDNHAGHSVRGRVRDGKRVSESLSPPVVASLPADINRRPMASSPPGKPGQSSSPSSTRQNRLKGSNSGANGKWAASHGEGNRYGTSGQHLLLNDVPIATLPSVPERSSSCQSAAAGQDINAPGSPSTIHGEPSLTKSLHSSSSPESKPESKFGTNSESPSQDSHGFDSPPGKLSRTDIMSSARSLLGSFWNGQ